MMACSVRLKVKNGLQLELAHFARHLARSALRHRWLASSAPRLAVSTGELTIYEGKWNKKRC
jgi:hypothetical protein